MNKTNLLGYTLADLESLLVEMGEKKYKGRQIFKWLYSSLKYDFNRMTDLTKELREKLDAKYTFVGLQPEKVMKSRDGTEKILFRLNDNKFIETVLISDGIKRTICVSTQVGCPIKCSFCATGLMGFKRNLTLGEILGQLLYAREQYGEDAFRNIVFMGMGEPLLNYDNLVQSIKIISSSIGFSLSARKVTISTVGIVPKIYALADSGLKANLAISLHAASDSKRRRILSIPTKYNLTSLMEAAACFARKRKKRVTFEYILFKGLNDSKEDALALAELIKGIPCKINILAYNPVENVPYRRPSEDEIDNFSKLLYPRAPAVTVRKSRGLDIDAACGQLAGKMQRKNR
jgi:23S rRNA (adenine2503-C2)-methyltransferase